MNKNFDKEKAKKRLAFVPLGLFILFALAFFAVGVTAFIYSIVTYLAFKSAIIFLIIFGSFAGILYSVVGNLIQATASGVLFILIGFYIEKIRINDIIKL